MTGEPTVDRVRVGELRRHLARYLSEVKNGGELVVTERGRPIARIVAVDPVTDVREKLIEAGIIRPATAKRSLPKATIKLKGDGPSLSDYVIEQRR